MEASALQVVGQLERFLSTALAGHTVGITQIDVDVWLVELAGHEPGLFEPSDARVAPFSVGRRKAATREVGPG